MQEVQFKAQIKAPCWIKPFTSCVTDQWNQFISEDKADLLNRISYIGLDTLVASSLSIFK